MAEQGIAVPPSEAWTAMWAPAHTPAAEVERVQRALQTILAAPDMREMLSTRLSVTADYRNGVETAQRQRDELATWRPIIAASGFKPD
jgi:tripartite-type tricarboxylate transporter receptor subunit TctC